MRVLYAVLGCYFMISQLFLAGWLLKDTNFYWFGGINFVVISLVALFVAFIKRMQKTSKKNVSKGTKDKVKIKKTRLRFFPKDIIFLLSL